MDSRGVLQSLWIVVAASLVHGCADPNMLARNSDFAPTFIPANPRAPTIAVVVSGMSYDSHLMCGGNVAPIDGQNELLRAFAARLVAGLSKKGYAVTRLNNPIPRCGLCDWVPASPSQSCRPADNYDAALINDMRAANVATAINATVHIAGSRQMFRVVEGETELEARRSLVQGNLVDTSGAAISLFRCCGSIDVKPAPSAGAADRYVLRTNMEWGSLMADDLLRTIPDYHPTYVPGRDRIVETLTQKASGWTVAWSGEMDRKGNGAHRVVFQNRPAGLVAQVGADSGIGNAAHTSEVTVTPFGISFFVQGLGRARLAWSDQGSSHFHGSVRYGFGGSVLATVTMRPN